MKRSCDEMQGKGNAGPPHSSNDWKAENAAFKSAAYRGEPLEKVTELHNTSVLDEDKVMWYYPDISGVREGPESGTYYGFEKLAPLPGGEGREKWHWMIGKQGIMAEDLHGLEDWQVVEKFGPKLSEMFESPTACYFVKGATMLDVENVTDGTQIFPFYNDQQDCVLWAAVFRPGKKDVVCAYSLSSDEPNHVYLNSISDPDGLESFVYRTFLESILSMHFDSYDVDDDSESVPELAADATEYLNSVKQTFAENEETENNQPNHDDDDDQQ